MDKKRILFIEDRKSQFEILKDVLDNNYFILINDDPIFDVGKNKIINRTEQKKQILETINNSEFDIILCDISMTEDDLPVESMDCKNYLSVEIYSEVKDKYQDKTFVFVTGHPDWTEQKFNEKIKYITKDALYMRKVKDLRERYVTCPFIVDQKTKCGKEFQKCLKAYCFNEVLRRLIEDGE